MQTDNFTNSLPAKILVTVVFVTFLAACNKQLKRISFGNKERDELKMTDFQFDYFSAKSKILFKDAHNELKATANVRMKKDSIIWVSLSATLGIEALRCLITEDSIFIIDRVNKEYLMLDYAQLSRKFNFKINYSILQSVILGNLPMKRHKNDPLRREGDYFVLQQESGNVEITNYINRLSMKLIMVKMVETTTNNKLNLNYGNFQYLENYIFPFKSLVSVEYTKNEIKNNTNLTIDYNKAEIEGKELRFPFNIPERFTRRRAI